MLERYVSLVSTGNQVKRLSIALAIKKLMSRLIFCGDFNEGSSFRGYQLLKKAFDEVKSFMDHKSSKKTLFSCLPLFEVDHIFFNGSLRVESVSVPITSLTKIASDHLPVIADFSLCERNP